jgi:hypothetical protein
MEWAALIAWVVTAGGGFVLLSIWLARGGMRQQREPGARIRPPLILSHFGLAAAGLVVWIIYLASDKEALTWIAFAILAVVALLGWTMFAIWWQRRKRAGITATVAETAGGAGSTSAGAIPAEQSFPVSIVALHGLLAVTTAVLVLLTALEIGTGS